MLTRWELLPLIVLYVGPLLGIHYHPSVRAVFMKWWVPLMIILLYAVFTFVPLPWEGVSNFVLAPFSIEPGIETTVVVYYTFYALVFIVTLLVGIIVARRLLR